jgi:hypothetical protein
MTESLGKAPRPLFPYRRASTENGPYFINNDHSKPFDQVNVGVTARLVQSTPPASVELVMLGRHYRPDSRVELPALA